MTNDTPQPERNREQPEPVRFDDRRHARIHDLLARIGDGPASMYRDMRRLMGGSEFIENPASALIHFVRELKSSIKDVLLPADFTGPEDNGDAAAIDAILQNLGLPHDHAIGMTWKKFKPHEIVHRRSLGRPLRVAEVQAAAAEFERMLEMLLDEMERSYSVVYVKVDLLLSKAQPGKKDVSKLLNKIPQNGQALGYFYSKANVAGWLDPLHKAGVFADLPSYAGWPALQFLRRAAETHAGRVAEILASIPIPESSMHQMQYLAVVEALPVSVRPPLLRRFADQRKNGDDFVIRDLVDAVAAIVPVDADAALAVATTLLRLHVRDDKTGSLRDIEAAFDVHTYGDVVTDAVPPIVAAVPDAALRAFADLLDSVLAEAREHGDEDDLSVSWRPSIAPHEQNHFFNPIEYLGDAVITAAEAAVRTNRARLHAVVADLLRREWTFFRRLALHLLTMFGDPTDTAVRYVVLRRENLQQYDLRREYHLLVSKVTPHFVADVKETLVHLILEGPDDAERLRERDPEYAAYYHDKWIKDRLAWIADALPDDVRASYEEMVARLGAYDEKDDFSGFITEWVGPQSPLPSDELATMAINEIVQYLIEWQPQRTHFVPTREGLGRELQRVAKVRAGEFAAAAQDFIGVDATYVRSVFAGLEDALKDGHAIAWDEALKLCEWAVAQPREISGRDHRGLDNDPHWGWARGAVASLLQTGLLAKDGLAPDRALRVRIWGILEIIMRDPDPDETRDEQLRDPTSTAINSTRGRALEAVMRYILWLRGGVTRPAQVDNFEDMQQLRALLDLHLDRNVDPSPAIRSMYGKWLFFLDQLAPAWLESKIPQMFPADDADLEDAALDAYVLYGQYTSDRMRTLLDEVFRRAIMRLAARKRETYTEREVPRRLGQQFILAYLSGSESLEAGSLLTMYFEAAEVENRADGLAFAVHQLKELGDDVDVRRRVVALWEWRVAVGAPGELAAFGRWIAADQLDAAWRLQQLEEALTRARGVDYEYDVMPTLAKLVAAHPMAVLRCARLAIANADRWQLYSYVHDGDMRNILETALAAADRAVQMEAKAIANVLVAHDFIDFRDLAERDLLVGKSVAPGE